MLQDNLSKWSVYNLQLFTNKPTYFEKTDLTQTDIQVFKISTFRNYINVILSKNLPDLTELDLCRCNNVSGFTQQSYANYWGALNILFKNSSNINRCFFLFPWFFFVLFFLTANDYHWFTQFVKPIGFFTPVAMKQLEGPGSCFLY